MLAGDVVGVAEPGVRERRDRPCRQEAVMDSRGRRPGQTGHAHRRAAAVSAVSAAGVAPAAALEVSAYPRWRQWCLSWGATDEEVARALPGGDLLAEPDILSGLVMERKMLLGIKQRAERTARRHG
jgi:hypothetical protein